ncbi:MAG: MBL fold metallo-hydrolase [Gammaproteobacteria bacterium]|nr:MBL fold metallo-hydrolase [Gammaproteobacteria bacterium]
MRKLTSIPGNSQKLDGGAMFGNAPKAMWSKWIPCDELNRIPLACRTLLIEEDDRKILLETGVGAFFEPKLRDRYGVVEEQHQLLLGLEKLGLSDKDIDIVILSHLHFDHSGGLLSPWSPEHEPELLFPNAQFVVGAEAWERALSPHPRDRASFIPHLNQLLEKSGRLQLITESSCKLLGPDYRFHISNGHTPGMLLTEVSMPDGPVVFMADLVPGTPWVHLPITMGYDRFPERVIEEKQEVLHDLLNRNARLFYCHDHAVALSRLQQDERRRYSACDQLAELQSLEA